MQRRLNTRFLVILTLVVGGSLVGAYVGGRFFFRGTAQKHVAMAELFVRENRFADAVGEYQKAISLDPRNPENYVKMGDALRQLTRTDPFVVDKDKQAWNSALEADPGYLPAMQRLLESYLEETTFWPVPTTFGRVRDISKRILQFDPSDNRARASLNIAWLQSWFAGVETSSQQIDESMKELSLLLEKDQSNVDVPYVLARAKVRRASDALRQNHDTEAKTLVQEALQVMQKAVAANPENAKYYMRQAQVQLEISDIYRYEIATQKAYRNQAVAGFTRAQELVKPEDSSYGEINMTAANMAAQDQKLDKAEKIYRDLLSRRPDDRSVRLALARLISNDPAKRGEAIELLEATISDDPSLVGARVRFRTEMELQTLAALTGLRIDSLAVAKTEEEKADQKERVEKNLKDIYNRVGETPEYLKLKGRLFQIQNQFVEAIQTYSRAVTMITQLGRPKDDELLFQLARVYAAAQQTGEARALLIELVRRHDTFVPARIMLAKILLSEGNVDDAAPHLKYLEKNAANDPQVVPLLLLASSGKTKEPARDREMLAKLPEGNHDQILDKAKLAMEVGDVAESQRLAEALLKQNSGDEEGVRILVQALLRQNKPEDAKKIVDKGLAANSDSQMLRLIKAQLDGNAEELSDAIDKNIDSIKDEYTREVAKFNRAEAKGNDKEAAEHLDKVEKLKPDLPEVWDLRFQYYAKRKQWDALQPYVQKLTAANYDRAGGLIYQFRLAMAKGDTDRAMDLAQQLTIKLPEFAQSFLARGQALQALNKYDEAAENYLRVLEKQATNFEAYRGLVECYYALHKYDAAGRHLAEARKRLPNNTILRQMEIEHELNYGQPEKVIGLLETRAAVRQDKAETWIVLGRAYERIVQRKAAKNDPEASQWAAKLKAHYAKAFDKWPDNTEIAAHYADACLMVNATDEAENALKLLVQKVPDRVEPVLMLAEFYTRVAQPSHAEMVLRDAMRKMPDRQELPNRLSQLLASIGRIDDSLLVLDQMNQPDKVLMAKLEILLQSGRFKDARGVAETAIKKNPDDINLLNAMAYVSLNDNDIQAARRYAEKSLSLKSANPIALYQRALVQMKQSPPDLDAAITDLKQAMLQLPTNVEFHGAAADAYLMRRDPDAAIRELETASKLAPRNRMIWMRLAELYMTSTPPRLEDCRSLVEQVRVAGAGNDPELAGVAARIAAQKQDIPTAISEMRRMVQLSGGSDVAWRSYLFMLLELKQNDLALKEVEELAKSLDLWWIHHVRATAKVRQGARDEAVAEWEKAMTLADKGHDENAAVMIVQGIAREMNVAQAMPLVLAKAKDDLRWMIFAASLYQAQGDMPKAVVMSEQVLASLDKLTPADQTRALQVAGMIYLQSRPAIADKAIKVYRKLLDKTPDDLATLNNLACLYVDNVKPSEPATALEFSQKAYDLMRKQGLSEPLIMDTHGWVLVRTGRYQEGLIMLQEVVQRQPFLEARYHLAEAYIKGNHPDAAVRQLQAAKDMITTAEKNKAVIDPEMRTRVDQAMTRAVAMVKQQSKETGDQ